MSDNIKNNLPSITENLKSFNVTQSRVLDNYLLDVANNLYELYEQCNELRLKAKTMAQKDVQELLAELIVLDKDMDMFYQVIISIEHEGKSIERIHDCLNLIDDEIKPLISRLNKRIIKD